MISLRIARARILGFIKDLNPYQRHKCQWCDLEFGGPLSKRRLSNHQVMAHPTEVLMDVLPIIFVSTMLMHAVVLIGKAVRKEGSSRGERECIHNG